MLSLTPEPTNNTASIAAEIIARCEKLRLMAVFVGLDGAVVSETPVELAPCALLHAAGMLAPLGQIMTTPQGARDRLSAISLAGFGTLLVGAVHNGGTPIGRLVVMLRSRAGLSNEVLTRWHHAIAHAKVDTQASSILAAPAGLNATTPEAIGTVALQCGSEDSLHLVEASILSALEDTDALRESREALSSFTSQLSDSYETIDVVYALGRAMRGPFDPSTFLASVCDRLHGAMRFRWIAAALDGLGPRAMRGRFACAGTPPVSAELMHEAAIALVQDLGPMAGAQIRTDAGLFCSRESPQVIALPIVCKGRVAGVLLAGGKDGNDPAVSSYDTQLLEAAASFTHAFADNVALYEDQRDLFISTVGALTAAIDAKDRYTFGHSERVAFLSADLARLLGQTEAQIETTRIAGLIHDVGKIGVPEHVLTKPGRLTDDEFALIKLHPETGHRILCGIAQLADVLPGVLHHHEHFNGRGYPHKLAGDTIPLLARIIAVADTFDAMSSNRSYRSALPRERVLDEIERCGGTQFDPQISGLIRRVDLAGFDAMVARHATQLSSAKAA